MLIEQNIVGFALLTAAAALCLDAFADLRQPPESAASFKGAMPFAIAAIVWAIITKIDYMQKILSPSWIAELVPITIGGMSILIRAKTMWTESKQLCDYTSIWQRPRAREWCARLAKDLRMFCVFSAGFALLCALLRILR